MKMPSPQNLKARLECGATASSIVIANRFMWGQNETAERHRENQKRHVEWNSLRMLSAATNAAMTSVTGKMNKYGRSTHLRCSSLLSSAARRSNSLLSGSTTGRGGNEAFRFRLRVRGFRHSNIMCHLLSSPGTMNIDVELQPSSSASRSMRTRKCGILKHYHGYSLAARRRET